MTSIHWWSDTAFCGSTALSIDSDRLSASPVNPFHCTINFLAPTLQFFEVQWSSRFNLCQDRLPIKIACQIQEPPYSVVAIVPAKKFHLQGLIQSKRTCANFEWLGPINFIRRSWNCFQWLKRLHQAWSRRLPLYTPQIDNKTSHGFRPKPCTNHAPNRTCK